mmetsp:Transcript_48513/g.109305  ORF Transcript_48513/g.109305 Transcript_48513/m.109305 type:complete len:229 (-) Transcript_48513:413-1099(-)
MVRPQLCWRRRDLVPIDVHLKKLEVALERKGQPGVEDFGPRGGGGVADQHPYKAGRRGRGRGPGRRHRRSHLSRPLGLVRGGAGPIPRQRQPRSQLEPLTDGAAPVGLLCFAILLDKGAARPRPLLLVVLLALPRLHAARQPRQQRQLGGVAGGGHRAVPVVGAEEGHHLLRHVFLVELRRLHRRELAECELGEDRVEGARRAYHRDRAIRVVRGERGMQHAVQRVDV